MLDPEDPSISFTSNGAASNDVASATSLPYKVNPFAFLVRHLPSSPYNQSPRLSRYFNHAVRSRHIDHTPNMSNYDNSVSSLSIKIDSMPLETHCFLRAVAAEATVMTASKAAAMAYVDLG